MIGISGSLIWSKTPMELIFNPCGKFRWSPKGPVSQIHSPHLHIVAPWDLFRSFKLCSDAKEKVWCVKLLLPPEFEVENLRSAELLPTVYEEQLETKFWRETENVLTLSLAQLLLWCLRHWCYPLQYVCERVCDGLFHHSIRTYSRDRLGFSVAPIPSAHVTKYRVVRTSTPHQAVLHSNSAVTISYVLS